MKTDLAPFVPLCSTELWRVASLKYLPLTLVRTVTVPASLSTFNGLSNDTPATKSAGSSEEDLLPHPAAVKTNPAAIKTDNNFYICIITF